MLMLQLVCAGLLLMLQAAPQSDFERSVEQQRGGRHWVDKKTDPPKSPQESLECFRIEPGSRIELVAAEPLVLDPVAIEFDERGRMYVAEYGDYPVGPKDPKAPRLSRIVVLEDTDTDGVMDRRTVFAADLAFCHSVMPLLGGILTCTETEIVFLKDTSGDDVADIREVWYAGFTPAHPQMQIGCPRWGYDNWIYLTYGPGNIECRRPGFESSEPVRLGGQDFRFNPLTMQFESVTGLGQFGNTFDSDGHRFFSTNRNPMITDVLPRAALSRNPFAALVTGHTDVGPAGENTRVYPLVDMKSNYLSHAGTHTSACGVTAYRGELFDESFRHSVFVCEPVGHLVTRNITSPDGATLTAHRAREKADFLASTDTWFRPASLSTGPDGALYLADMYRLWVEHPKFVPDDVAAKMDWRAGEDRGRVWRIIPDDRPTVRSIPAVKIPESQIAMLRDANGWRRLLAQRFIVENQLVSAEDAVRKLLLDTTASAHTRMQALWTLNGLGRCSRSDICLALQDDSPIVRRDAARIAGQQMESGRLTDAGEISRLLESLCEDSNLEVRLHSLLAVGSVPSSTRSETISRAAVVAAADPWLQAALLSSCADCSGVVLETLVTAWHAEKDGGEAGGSAAAGQGVTRQARVELLGRLASVVAARGDQAELQQVLTTIAEGSQGSFWWQAAILAGVAEGLPRTASAALPKSLNALLSQPPESLTATVEKMRELMDQAVRRATDGLQSEADRLAAVRLLPYQTGEVIAATAEVLLNTDQPVSCQLAAMNVVRQSGRTELVLMVLNHWDTLGPGMRSQALDLILSRRETVQELLNRMAAGAVSPSVVSIDQRLRLLQFPDAGVQQAAGQLFGGTVSTNRREVADQYQEALTMKASAAAGAKVFEKTCSKCHRIDGVGHQVGPDISDTRSRSRDALLYDILDPNRRVDPQYTDYITVLTDGRTLNGLLVSESGDTVVLRQPEGLQQSIPRLQIEELRSMNRSLMPEGVEKDVSVQQMADLLEFLKTR